MTAPNPPDGVWIDVTGCTHLYGGERAMLDGLVKHLADQGLRGRAAIADTPGGAHAMARFAGSSVVVVDVGGVADAVALLPVKALRLDGLTIGGLRKLGLDLVGQLATAPRGPLARRFGAGLLLRLDQALGRVSEPIEPVLPSEIVAVRRSFVEPLSTPEAFATVIAVLVEEACAQLERRGEGARRLDLRYERVDATVQVVSAGNGATGAECAASGPAAGGADRSQVDPGLGVEAMLLVLPLVEALGYRQQGSGLGTDRPGEAALAELVDRLSNRLGADRVYRLMPLESDVPERSQTRVPVFGPAGATPWTSPWPRPVRLLRRPEQVEALAMMPDHPPKAFTWRRVRHRVTHADGPERITGEWWRRPGEVAAVRDYWAVENTEGRRFWLYRQGDGLDPATGGLSWFLHGFF